MKTKNYILSRDMDGARVLWEENTDISFMEKCYWTHAHGSYLIGMIADDDGGDEDKEKLDTLIGPGYHGVRKGRKALIKVTPRKPIVERI